MDLPRIQLQGISMVFLGQFNPAIFQPAWFASEGLIPEKEAENAEVQIIHPEFASFSLEWLNFRVGLERLSMETVKEPYYEILRDLAIGTFRLLRHTPIQALGINRSVHIAAESEEQWHDFGHSLAPKEPWGGILETPGLRQLVMQGKRKDGYNGFIRVIVEPSSRYQQSVFLSVNDHIELEKSEPTVGCKEIIEALASSWEQSMNASDDIITNLWKKT